MNLPFIFCLIQIFQLISCKSLTVPDEIDLTDLSSLYDGLNQVIDMGISDDVQNNIDINYLIPDEEVVNVESTTPPISYQDFINTPEKNHEYELVLNQYDESYPMETPKTKNMISNDQVNENIIYVPVDYSIEFQNHRLEYATKKAITTKTLKKATFVNSTFNSTHNFLLNKTIFNHTNGSIYLNISLKINNEKVNLTISHFNSTQTNSTSTKNFNQSSNITATSVTTSAASTTTTTKTITTTTATTTTTTTKKSLKQKTILRLESSFDELYDINAMPRQQTFMPNLAHLIEKRIHNHNEKMRPNTQGR